MNNYSEKKPIVLIVEDKVKSLKARSRLFTSLGMIVVTAQNLEEAKKKFSLTPSISLVVCDYNLDDSDHDNDDGVLFAKELRERGFEGPMVLYSGRDGVDINKNIANKLEDGSYNITTEKPFNFSAPRARMAGDKREEWFTAAINSIQTKSETGAKVAADIASKYDISLFDLKPVIELVPGSQEKLSIKDDFSDLLQYEKMNFESEIRRDGFEVIVLNPDTVYDNADETIKLRKPLTIWLNQKGKKISVEALGCPEANAYGDNKKSAIANLLILMKNSLSDNDKPDVLRQFSNSFVK